jgi:hypothetical protein
MKNHIQLEITSIEEASTNISVTLHKKNEKEMHEFINESKVLKLLMVFISVVGFLMNLRKKIKFSLFAV